MAYSRKRMFKKWRRKRRTFKPKTGRPSKSMVQSKYFFTRNISEVRSSLASPTAGQWFTNSGGTETSWYQSFELNDLNDYTDYTNLFTAYRINAVKVTIIPQNTEVVYPQFQCMVYIIPNQFGRYSTSANVDEQIALDTQAVKKRRLTMGKPLTMYVPVKQLVPVYNSPTNDYVKVKPKLISTDEVDTPHYGLTLLFVNQNGSGLPAIPVRIYTKYYLEMRGAK